MEARPDGMTLKPCKARYAHSASLAQCVVSSVPPHLKRYSHQECPLWSKATGRLGSRPALLFYDNPDWNAALSCRWLRMPIGRMSARSGQLCPELMLALTSSVTQLGLLSNACRKSEICVLAKRRVGAPAHLLYGAKAVCAKLKHAASLSVSSRIALSKSHSV